MRSIWLHLASGTVAAVGECLRQFGARELPDEGGTRWNLAPLSDPEETALFIHVDDDIDGFAKLVPEEFEDACRWAGNRRPVILVGVDVSGRLPGDAEVRIVASSLLRKFGGHAFDDVLSYEHGWSIEEIERDALVHGLRFFDYKGYFLKHRTTEH